MGAILSDLIVIVFNLFDHWLMLQMLANGDPDYCGDFLNLECYDARNGKYEIGRSGQWGEAGGIGGT